MELHPAIIAYRLFHGDHEKMLQSKAHGQPTQLLLSLLVRNGFPPHGISRSLDSFGWALSR
jgi:hypothetical protein